MQSAPVLPQIQTLRKAYKTKNGFEYPQFFEVFSRIPVSAWDPQSVNMSSDVLDYNNSLEHIQNIIAGILKSFTIMETHIGDYWSDKVSAMFPKHEIIAMCRGFAYQEQIHAWAYNHLSDSLGLNDFDAFLTDKAVIDKISYFLKERGDLVSLAIFSAAGEGIMLFGQFACLLSLSRDGKFKGLAQIISWSALEEASHYKAGCDLLNTLIAERGITEEEKKDIYEGINTVLNLEINSIKQIFAQGELPYITLEEDIDYLKIRANEVLTYIGLEPQYKIQGVGYKVKEWFETEVKGLSSNDFFWQAVNGQAYSSKTIQDFEAFDIKELSGQFRD